MLEPGGRGGVAEGVGARGGSRVRVYAGGGVVVPGVFARFGVAAGVGVASAAAALGEAEGGGGGEEEAEAATEERDGGAGAEGEGAMVEGDLR